MQTQKTFFAFNAVQKWFCIGVGAAIFTYTIIWWLDGWFPYKEYCRIFTPTDCSVTEYISNHLLPTLNTLVVAKINDYPFWGILLMLVLIFTQIGFLIELRSTRQEPLPPTTDKN